MAKEIMVEVDNVSMKFNLGIEKSFSLKQFFIDIFDSENICCISKATKK